MTHVRALESKPLLTPSRSSLTSEELQVLSGGVRLMALRALGDADLADDVAQETMTRTVLALGRAGAPIITSPAAFVHGVAKHIIADMRRANRRIEPLERANDPADPRASDPLDAAVSAEEAARVHAAMLRLTPNDREILRLSFFEDMTVAALSAMFGEPALRVRKRKSRALERLRQAFFGHERTARATTRSGVSDSSPLRAPEDHAP